MYPLGTCSPPPGAVTHRPLNPSGAGQGQVCWGRGRGRDWSARDGAGEGTGLLGKGRGRKGGFTGLISISSRFLTCPGCSLSRQSAYWTLTTPSLHVLHGTGIRRDTTSPCHNLMLTSKPQQPQPPTPASVRRQGHHLALPQPHLNNCASTTTSGRLPLHVSRQGITPYIPQPHSHS